MSYKENKADGSRKGGTLVAGILLGMLLGVAAAGGVAWYILKKNPSSFENKERHEIAKPEQAPRVAPPVVLPPAPMPASAPVPASSPVPTSAPLVESAPLAASAVAASAVVVPKQHFEFYKVLTEKPDGSTPKAGGKPDSASPKAAAKPDTAQKTAHPAPVAQPAKPVQAIESTKEIYYVQAGSFPKVEDAENLKANLAILGFEASIQTAVIPDRGSYHRVRLGPYTNSTEMNKVLALLKQNGMSNAVPIKVQ